MYAGDGATGLPILAMIHQIFPPVPDFKFVPNSAIASFQPYGLVYDWGYYYEQLAQSIRSAVMWVRTPFLIAELRCPWCSAGNVEQFLEEIGVN